MLSNKETIFTDNWILVEHKTAKTQNINYNNIEHLFTTDNAFCKLLKTKVAVTKNIFTKYQLKQWLAFVEKDFQKIPFNVFLYQNSFLPQKFFPNVNKKTITITPIPTKYFNPGFFTNYNIQQKIFLKNYLNKIVYRDEYVPNNFEIKKPHSLYFFSNFLNKNILKEAASLEMPKIGTEAISLTKINDVPLFINPIKNFSFLTKLLYTFQITKPPKTLKYNSSNNFQALKNININQLQNIFASNSLKIKKNKNPWWYKWKNITPHQSKLTYLKKIKINKFKTRKKDKKSLRLTHKFKIFFSWKIHEYFYSKMNRVRYIIQNFNQRILITKPTKKLTKRLKKKKKINITTLLINKKILKKFLRWGKNKNKKKKFLYYIKRRYKIKYLKKKKFYTAILKKNQKLPKDIFIFFIKFLIRTKLKYQTTYKIYKNLKNIVKKIKIKKSSPITQLWRLNKKWIKKNEKKWWRRKLKEQLIYIMGM